MGAVGNVAVIGGWSGWSTTETRKATVVDDGAGNLIWSDTRAIAGSINYTTGEVTINSINKSYGRRRYQNGVWSVYASPEYTGNDATIRANYDPDAVTPSTRQENTAVGLLELDLNPTTTLPIMPGSVLFNYGAKDYYDLADGKIYTDIDPLTGSGTEAGTVNYLTGIAVLSGYTGGSSGALTIKSLLVIYGPWEADSIRFRTAGAPLRPGSLFVRATKPDGTLVSATSDLSGNLFNADLTGDVNNDTGVVEVNFGRLVPDASLTAGEKLESWYDPLNIDENGDIWKPAPVTPNTIRYNAVVYSLIPLSAEILGLDPIRLPIDGRVPMIRSADVIVIHSTISEDLPAGLIADQVVTLSRDNLAQVEVKDQLGVTVSADKFTVDKSAGTITMANPLDLTGYTEPLVATHRIEDMSLVNEAEISGRLALVSSVSRDYSAADTFISSALIFGDLASRVHHQFSQITWTSTWSDVRSGSPTSAQYNDVLYPIQINNLNSAKERWALVFTSSTTFNCYGEQAGLIASGDTSTDFSPINPITGQPYFTVLAAGWGGGWAINNALRFNTDAANHPMWIARTTINGAPTAADDSFRIQIRGDAD